MLVETDKQGPKVVTVVPSCLRQTQGRERGGFVLDSSILNTTGPEVSSFKVAANPLILSPDQIPIAPELISAHPFEHFIQKPGLLSLADFQQIVAMLQLSAPLFRSGAIPASCNGSTDYDNHSWSRDSSIYSHALWAVGHCSEALRGAVSWSSFYNRPSQRDRFLRFHFDPDPVALYRDGPNDIKPHARARIVPGHGELVESTQSWQHNQLDTIGMWLRTSFNFGLTRAMELQSLNRLLSRRVNEHNESDSILCVGLRFLFRVNFWNQWDVSTWEDEREPQRTSSISPCLSAFKIANQFFRTFGWDAIRNTPGKDGRTLKSEIEEGIALGEEALQKRLPLDGAFALETERFPSDAAFLFSLHPFNPGLTVAQENAMLNALYRDRMTPYGFSRRDGDHFVGIDYAHRSEGQGIWADPGHPNFEPASWCLDSYAAAFYYDRYVRSGNIVDLFYADRHARRSLSQFTKENEEFLRVSDGVTVKIPKLRIPEARWRDSKTGLMRPNHNTPLLMGEAGFLMMLERMSAALGCFANEFDARLPDISGN